MKVPFFILTLVLISFSQAEEFIVEREWKTFHPSTWAFQDERRELPDGLWIKQFTVPPTFLRVQTSPAEDSDSLGVGLSFSDPFQPKSRVKVKSAKEMLEDAGITFGEQAFAHYNPIHSILTVVNTSDQLDLVEAYGCFGWNYSEKVIQIRVEIYGIDESVYQTISKSSKGESIHTPERNALSKAAEDTTSGVERITSALINARSGNRVSVFQGKRNNISSDSEYVFEIDSFLEADNWTVNLHLDLKIGGSDSLIEASSHSVSNEWVIMGGWKDSESKRRVILVRPEVQFKRRVRSLGKAADLQVDLNENLGYEKINESLYRAYFRMPRSTDLPPRTEDYKKQSFVKWFMTEGIGFPEGTKAEFDPNSNVLEIIQRPAVLSIISMMLASQESSWNVKVESDVYAIPAQNLDELTALILNSSDHSAALALLRSKLDLFAYQHIEHLSTTIQSGQRAVIETVDGEFLIPHSAENEVIRYGAFFEAEPAVSIDGSVVELDFLFRLDHEVPQLIEDKGRSKLKTYESQVQSQAAVTLGIPYLAGSWHPYTSKGVDASVCHLLFIQANAFAPGGAERVKRVK